MTRLTGIIPAAMLFGAISASSSGAQNMTAEQYLEAARSVMHLSCRGVVDTFGDDDEAIVDAVEKMVAVSLINREIDVTTLELTQQEKDEIWPEFADRIEDACSDDADALLGGIVDHVVADIIQFY